MNLKNRIEAFSNLGILIKQLVDCEIDINNDRRLNSFVNANPNEWFTPSNILFMLKNISEMLEYNALKVWIDYYGLSDENSISKNIGLVTAGNIPLVGFHDVLCILISGHKLMLKNSTKDEKLMDWMLKTLIDLEPEFERYVHIETERLKDFDAVIATGSDNTSKYFEYYFGKYPNIIRKNRNSIAVLSEDVTDNDLELLADDMLLYFGLGCRNVSKLYLPEDFDIQRIFKATYDYEHLINHNKYANNHIYNKSIYLMNNVRFLENGFLTLKEDVSLNSPISVVFYERYGDPEVLKNRINSEKDKIQCIVSKIDFIEDRIAFGHSQKPGLMDYADNIDTIRFLLSLE